MRLTKGQLGCPFCPLWSPGNPAIALNPGAVTPGNNIGNQPLNPGNQLANPNNSLTPGQANLANPQSTVTPGQQAATPSTSQTPLQNVKRTAYSIHDIPSIYDNTPVPRRPLPNYTQQELEIFRNHTSDWHTNFNWPFEVQDLISGHGLKHVYETPKAIADRILNPQPGARIPTASSRAFDPNSAEYFIKETLRYNSNIIDNWLLNSKLKDSLELKYIPSSGELTGFGIPRGGTHFMPTYGMTVWLVRTQNGYILDKHYPSFK